jgi:hypothetical protein
LRRQSIVLECLQAPHAQRPVEIRVGLTRLWAHVEHPLAGFRDHRAVDTGEALSRDLGLKLGSQLQIGLRAEFERRPFLGTLPQPVRDVVLGDDEVLAEIVAAADYYVTVRVAGVEMVDRDPIEPRAEVFLHLRHHIPGEGPGQAEATLAVVFD